MMKTNEEKSILLRNGFLFITDTHHFIQTNNGFKCGFCSKVGTWFFLIQVPFF